MDLDTIAEVIEDMLKDIIQNGSYPYGRPQPYGLSNKVASGSLLNSIDVVTKQTDTTWTIEILANDYYQWVNSGRNPGGKKVPISAILNWLNYRKPPFNVNRSSVKYQAPLDQVSLAYAINKRRIKDGKKPIPMKILVKWVVDKGYRMKYNEEQLRVSQAYAIQTNIHKFGIRPAAFDNKLFERIYASEELMREIEALGVQVIEDIFEFNFKDTKIQ